MSFQLSHILLCFLIFTSGIVHAQNNTTNYQKLSEDALKFLSDLVSAKTVTGSEMNARTVIEDKLKSLGLKYEYIESADMTGKDRRPNFVVRLQAAAASRKRAMLILAHIDVVSAVGQTWSQGLDPHKMEIEDDFVYGRGVWDMLGYASSALEVVAEIKRSNTPLERDLIFMFTSDEEKGGFNGIQWMMQNRPDLFKDIEFAVTEGGAVITDINQKPLFIGYAAAEKIYQDYKIVTRGPTGHSSTPTKVTAINLINDAIEKIRKSFGVPALTELTKAYVQERASIETDVKLKELLTTISRAEVGEDLNQKYKKAVDALEENYRTIHAILRRTCVTTVLTSGSDAAKNALPAQATAYVNCRLMPHEDLNAFTTQLKNMIDVKDPQNATQNIVEITPEAAFYHGPASTINGPVPMALKELAGTYLGGIPVIPSILTGGTDARFLRMSGIDSYGVGPIFISEADRSKAHGIDERIYVGNISYGMEFFHRLVLSLVAPKQRLPASISQPVLKYSKEKEVPETHHHEDHGGFCQH